MAYIVNTTRSPVKTAATTSNAALLGAHQSGDLLIVWVSKSAAMSSLTTSTSGWTVLASDLIWASWGHAVAYKIAASSAEPGPVFTSTNTGSFIMQSATIRDAHATTPFGSTPTVGTDYRVTSHAAATSFSSGALTTAASDCLVFHSYASGGTSTQLLRPKNDSYRCLARDNSAGGAAVVHTVGYLQMAAAGAVPTVTTYGQLSAASSAIVISVRNKSGGIRQPDIRPTVNILRWYGRFGSLHDASTTLQAASNFATSIGTYGGAAINCSTTAPGASTLEATTEPETGWGACSSWNGSFSAASQEAGSGAGVWFGPTHTITSTNLQGAIFFLTIGCQIAPASPFGNEGWLVAFKDSAGNWAAYQIRTYSMYWLGGQLYTAAIALGNATTYASSGTVDWADITRVGYFYHRISSDTTSYSMYYRNAFYVKDPTAIVGGGSGRPATFVDYVNAITSWGDFQYAQVQGSAQSLLKSTVQIGDGGTNAVYFDAAASATEFPPEFSALSPRSIGWNALDGSVSVKVKAGASDTVLLGSCALASDTLQSLELDAATSTSAAYDFGGAAVVGLTPTWKTGIDADGITFRECGPCAFKGADVTDCTISATTATSSQAAATWDASGATVTRTTIDVTGTSAGYHIELGASVTAITLNGVIFTGTPGTDKIHALATTGTVTITVDGTGTSITSADVTSAGATISIVSPALERGLEFTGLVAGSKVKVFSTGTDTEQFSTASSGTTETWDDASSGSLTVDYVIMKAGYEPIRVTGVTVTGAVGTGVQSVPVSQVPARWYQASSGLTINTNVFANASTKLWGLTTASTLQNLASYLLEQWIALGDTGEAYANKAWPLSANGPNSFTWLNGWEADTGTYAASITNLSRDGMRYADASGTVTAMWAALLSVGVPAGALVRYQQTDGGTTVSAAATGNIDALVQIYGDATHGNFDRTGYLVAKVQEMGYDQAEVDVVGQYGTLEDQLYVIGLAPTANGVATGNPSLSTAPTISVGTYTEDGKTFTVKIVDGATPNTGTNIMRWLRYNFETGGAFQSKDAFDWHDLVQTNGSAFKTVRGTVYGTETTRGVLVYENDGTTLHSDFTLFTADDGSTYAPVIPAVAEATILANSRVQLYNVTTATEIDNTFVAGTSYSYTITTEASVGDTLRLRVCKKGCESTPVFAVWAAAGVEFLVSQPEDTVYTAWGIDGDTVTEYSLDGPNLQIDANDVDGATTKTRLGAFYSAALASSTSGTGIRDFYGALSFLSTAAIRVNVDIADLFVENVNATTALRFTDLDVRLYKSDGTSIIAPTSYSIHNDYSGVPDVVETGVSGLTGSESAQLMGLTNAPSASAVADAVWSKTLP